MRGPAAETVVDARRRLIGALEASLVPIGQHRVRQRTACLPPMLAGPGSEPVVTVAAPDGRLAFDYSPDREAVPAVRIGDTTISVANPGPGDVPLHAYPTAQAGIETDVTEWYQAIDQPPPAAVASIEESRERLDEALATTRAAATLRDLVAAIRAGDRGYVELLLDVDEPIDARGHTELAGLWQTSFEAVPYRDAEVALIVPPFPAETDPWLSAQARPPAEAYVVGRDDTPSGFFVHAVDATLLPDAETISRDDIRDVMGFDRSLAPETDALPAADGLRIRMQGDLVIQRTDDAPVARDRLESVLEPHVQHDVSIEHLDQFFRDHGLDPRHKQAFTISAQKKVSITPDVDLPAGSAPPPEVKAAVIAGEAMLAARASSTGTDHGDPPRPQRGTWSPPTGPEGVWESTPFSDRSVRIPDAPPGTFAARYQRVANHLRRGVNDSLDTHRQAWQAAVERRLEAWMDPECEAGAGQLNLAIDNHVVILGTGWIDSSSTRSFGSPPVAPVDVLVPGDTSLHVVHDEHPQVDVTLPAGGYTLTLLDRGLQPDVPPTWTQ